MQDKSLTYLRRQMGYFSQAQRPKLHLKSVQMLHAYCLTSEDTEYLSFIEQKLQICDAVTRPYMDDRVMALCRVNPTTATQPENGM